MFNIKKQEVLAFLFSTSIAFLFETHFHQDSQQHRVTGKPERQSFALFSLVFSFQVHTGPRVDGKEYGKTGALDGQVEEGIEGKHLGQHLAPSVGIHGAKGGHKLGGRG